MRLPLTLSLPRGNAHEQDMNDDAAMISDETAGELVLIELQGQLELTIEGDKQDKEDAVHVHPDGQRIGKLDMSVPTRPTLLIGHHKLIGQIVKLNAPLAILKHTLPVQAFTPSSSNIPLAPPTSSPLNHRTYTGDENNDNGKRARSQSRVDEEDDDGPSKSLNLQADLDGNAPNTPALARNPKTTVNITPHLAPPPSSAISSRTQAQHTPLNVSELKSGKHEIVGLIRRKIIFSKRPEPIVKLDEQSEDEENS